MRQLLSKGPNFREVQTINFSKCKEEIKSALSINIESVAVKYSLTPEELYPWKNKVMQLVDSRIKDLKSKITISKTKPSLHSQDVKSVLAKLHDKFVIFPLIKHQTTSPSYTSGSIFKNY